MLATADYHNLTIYQPVPATPAECLAISHGDRRCVIYPDGLSTQLAQPGALTTILFHKYPVFDAYFEVMSCWLPLADARARLEYFHGHDGRDTPRRVFIANSLDSEVMAIPSYTMTIQDALASGALYRLKDNTFLQSDGVMLLPGEYISVRFHLLNLIPEPLSQSHGTSLPGLIDFFKRSGLPY